MVHGQGCKHGIGHSSQYSVLSKWLVWEEHVGQGEFMTAVKAHMYMTDAVWELVPLE